MLIVMKLVFFQLLFVSFSEAQQRKKFTQEHLVSWPRPESLGLNPSNTHGLYFTSTFNLNKSRAEINAHLIAFKQKDNKFSKVTTKDVSERFKPYITKMESIPEFVWLDDESILFSSQDKLYVLESLFKENMKIERLKKFNDNNNNNEHTEISSLKYVQSTKMLLFSAVVHPYGINKKYGNFTLSKKVETKTGSGLVYDNLMVRHWDKFITPNKRHIFSINIECFYSNDEKEKSCKIKDRAYDIVENKLLESPIAPDFGIDDFDASPNGDKVAFVSKAPVKNSAWSTATNIYLSDVDIKKPPYLVYENIGQLTSPTFSHDGKYLCWLQKDVPQYESAKNNIVFYNIQTKKKERLFQWFDRSPTSIKFTIDSKHIIALVEDTGINRLYLINLKSRKIHDLTGKSEMSVGTYMLFKNYGLIYSASSINKPPEYYFVENKTNKKNYPIQITNTNTENIKDISLVEAKEVWFEGALNENVHAYVLLPPNFNTWRYYPAAMLIHGGPQGAWLNSWSYRWNPNIFANAGYVVFMINFHGSTGYGQQFTDSIRKNWGSYPFTDIMKGFRHLLQNIPNVDDRRVCALGASYGGYMVNWINGQTDRFRCLVNHDGMFSTLHQYYTTDELYFPEHEFGGAPWENYEIYQKFSPSNYVFRWSTPTLVIHSQKDYRLDLGEGLATFTALQRRGINSKFLYFPDENHWVTKHLNSLQWHNEVINWINAFCRPIFSEKEQKAQLNNIK